MTAINEDIEQQKNDVERRIHQLEAELIAAREELELLGFPSESNHSGLDDDARMRSIAPTLSKRGYLFKWSDRSIGWGGSKWGLRFVVLENGRLSYYLTHTDASPRYVLNLRGCAVRDDGWKINRRHPTKKGSTPPLGEPGAYFFVFSVYERPEKDDPKLAHKLDIVPLLRFSTPSKAEHARWIQLISDSCKYSETDAFLCDEAARAAEVTRRQEEEANMAKAMPESRDETLPMLIFAPPPKPNMISTKQPSVSSFALSRNKSFVTKSIHSDLDKHERQSKKSYPPSKPMHRAAEPSLLSPDAKTQNFRGFLNLGFLILLVSNLRLILHTIREHGFAVTLRYPERGDFSLFSEDPWKHFPFVTAFLFQLGFVFFAFGIEWMLSRKPQLLDEGLGMCLHYTNAFTALLMPASVVWTMIDNPATGFMLIFHATITFMKLISYAQANEDLRNSRELDDPAYTPRRMVEDLDIQDADILYPHNVTLRNLLYFWCAPTLTYQIAFPKFPRVRWWKVFTILSRMAAVAMVGAFLIAQIVNPTLKGLVHDLQAAQGKFVFHVYAEYWLKLAITSTYLWLLLFYGYFHLYLNLFAELLRFGDRIFYRDWWNSATAGAFWRLWNMPVHYWLVRHVYFPCIRLGMKKSVASFVVFFFSAIMHEVLISVPFHMVRPWSFLGMIFQIPLVGVTKYIYRVYPGSSIGNYIFWVSFCVVGQPMAVLLYAVDYQVKKRMENGLQ